MRSLTMEAEEWARILISHYETLSQRDGGEEMSMAKKSKETMINVTEEFPGEGSPEETRARRTAVFLLSCGFLHR